MNDLDAPLSPPATRAATEKISLSRRTEPLRIALVEDNVALRRLLALVLLRDGHDVVESGDAGGLLDLLADGYVDTAATPIDLVICEQVLPGIVGLSLLSGLRAHDRRTPFILITGDDTVQIHARRLGAVVLDHPFTLAAIRRAVRQACDVPMAAND